MLEKANNIKRSNTNSKNEIVCCLLSAHRGETTLPRRRDGSSVSLELGLPGVGWVAGGSKGAVPSAEVRCTQLPVGACPGEGLPPSLPSAPHAGGLPLWALGDLFLSVHGSTRGLGSPCWLPAPRVLVMEREERPFTRTATLLIALLMGLCLLLLGGCKVCGGQGGGTCGCTSVHGSKARGFAQASVSGLSLAEPG